MGRRPFVQRVLLGLTLGAFGLAVGACLPAPAETPVVCFWVADRDADRVYGLGRDLRVACERTHRAPLRVFVLGGGGSPGVGWVLEGTDPPALVSYQADGEAEPRLAVPGFLDAVVVGDELVWIEARGDVGWLRVWNGRAPPANLLTLPRPVALASDGREVLLAFGVEELALVRPTRPARLRARTEPIARNATWGSVLSLAPAAGAGRWWILHGRGGAEEVRSLSLFDEGLRPLWTRGVDAGVDGLAAAGDGVWLLGGAERVPRRVHPSARVDSGASLPLFGLQSGCAQGKGLISVAAGAVLELGETGALRHTQGGFRHLVDVVAQP